MMYKLKYILVFPIFVLIRLLRPLVLIRIGKLSSSRIGHFAANTEIYLCERLAGINKPASRCVDLFYVNSRISNQQLFKMWQRTIRIWPSYLLAPIYAWNKIIPGGQVHDVGSNTRADRDVHNLLDVYPAKLTFNDDEEELGKKLLIEMGLPLGCLFVCLFVRDSAYLGDVYPEASWEYHNYRDSDINNYVTAVRELVSRGYYVVRMGEKVKEPLNIKSNKVIDYATIGMRSDFMDIYLGAKCKFCISTGSGWDAIPAWLFRKPTIFTNLVPLGYAPTFSDKYIITTKVHFDVLRNRPLTLREIFSRGVGLCLKESDYTSKGIKLLENTPDEIKDVVIEMIEYLDKGHCVSDDDLFLQNKFWGLYMAQPKASDLKPLHGEIRARFSASYLRNNTWWLS